MTEFPLFHNHLSLEMDGALHLSKLESPYPRMLCAEFNLIEIDPTVLEKNVSKIFTIRNYLPLENSFEQLTWISFTQEYFVPSLVEIVFWRRRFLNFVNAFSLFRYYLPLEKGGVLCLNKLESPSPKDALCQVECANE